MNRSERKSGGQGQNSGESQRSQGNPSGSEPQPVCDPELNREFVEDFGRAYQRFGLPTLMGNIIGLLLCSSSPLSLDAITRELGVSKGPVSQVMSRLRDHQLVIRIRRPGNRKDYYQPADDIFGQAFANHATKLGRNLDLARLYKDRLQMAGDSVPPHFAKRIDEMEEFYSMMMDYYTRFLGDWRQRQINRKKREER